jgi:hypothetical protein
VPSRLLYFPDENHWVTKPANSIKWHEEGNFFREAYYYAYSFLFYSEKVIGWIDEYTSQKTSNNVFMYQIENQ